MAEEVVRTYYRTHVRADGAVVRYPFADRKRRTTRHKVTPEDVAAVLMRAREGMPLREAVKALNLYYAPFERELNRLLLESDWVPSEA